MASSSQKDMISSYSLVEESGKNLVAQLQADSGIHDLQHSKNFIQNSIFRTGTFSSRSNTPSIVDSVWDGSSAVHSVQSPASCEVPFLELQVPEQCGRSSNGDSEGSNFPQIPEPREAIKPPLRCTSCGECLPGRIPDSRRNCCRCNSCNKCCNCKDGTVEDRTNDAKNGLNRDKYEEFASDFEEDDMDSDDDEDDDNEWGGEPDRIEMAVLSNVDNLELAAWLIVELHRDQIHNEARKIGGWQRGMINCQNSDSSENSQQPYTTSSTDKKPSKSHKRVRLSGSRGRGSDDEGDGDDREDNEGNGSPDNHDDASASGDLRGRYACPFNKLYPDRFCSNTTTGNQYRVCESGYKTIQRLKEHIKRKHLSIQCERCFKVFSGKGKTSEESVAELRKHRQQREPCALGSPEPNAGINMEQWTLLDRSGGKKRQKVSEVEKWNEIWDTIYPDQPRPTHPWAERTTPGVKPCPAPANTQNFARLFSRFLDHETGSGDIQFAPGEELLMKTRMNSMALKVYKLHTDLNDTPSFGNSSTSDQTATQVTMPSTPIQRSPNLPRQRVSGPKMDRHGGPPMLMPNPQTQFGMLEPQMTAMNYGTSPAFMNGPSQGLVLDQQDLNWTFGDINQDWSGFLQEDHDMPYIPQNEQN